METKIQLSPAEMKAVCNAELILTKNRVLQKTTDLLQSLQDSMIGHELLKKLPPVITRIPPKISRGENYGGLPYLVLDYPRLFTPTAVFAVRTFFWWGRFFSSTLHLSGLYAREAAPLLLKHYEDLKKAHYIGIHQDPWQHHFEGDNYAAIDTLTHTQFRQQLSAGAHIKIAAKWPLPNWPSAATSLFKNWEQMLSMISITHPGGETGL